MTTALIIGRFHALTRSQEALLDSLGRDPTVERMVCVLTSADHADTRRNPLPVELRERLVRPLLERSTRPFSLVRLCDIPDDARWVAHVAEGVAGATGRPLLPAQTRVVTANRDVAALFRQAGFEVVSPADESHSPAELIAELVAGRPWRHLASSTTLELYDAEQLVPRLVQLFADQKRTADGELAAHRDFNSYGAAMDASLRQKLDDLLPWVLPGRIVDKGCGTGKLLVELSRSFPTSAFVGVDLSREFLRRCDENTYHAEDVTFVRGDAAEVQLPSGSATTILFSSIMHEIYSYSGYDQAQVERALASAATELAPGGRLLIRDGVSPGPGRWRLRLLHAQTRETFRRFAVEFKRGKGAQHRWVSEDTVELSAHLANEFLCKKDYLKSWDIEVHEEFGVRTVNEWRDALGRHGFDLLELCSVVNPWIVQHRYEGQVELTDVEGHPIPWPATNVIVAAERRGGEAAGARPDRPRER